MFGFFFPDLVQNKEHIKKPWYQNIMIWKNSFLFFSPLDGYCSYIIKIQQLDIKRHVFIFFMICCITSGQQLLPPPPFAKCHIPD